MKNCAKKSSTLGLKVQNSAKKAFKFAFIYYSGARGNIGDVVMTNLMTKKTSAKASDLEWQNIWFV